MTIQVLVPTYKKTKTDIINLFDFLNIQSDCIFANQTGTNEIYEIKHKNHSIRVICSATIGVSVNRNILKDNLEADIGLCIDDDCPLIDNYLEIVINAYKKYKFDFAIFNGVWETHGNKKIHNKKTKKVRRFIDISYAGGPGLCFLKNAVSKFDLSYDETIGVPNYICAGEDSLFYYNLCRSGAKCYRFSDIIFRVAIDETNSTYFQGINRQYITTRGYILKLTHRRLFALFVVKHTLRFKKQSKKLKLFEIIKYLIDGGKMAKLVLK